MWFFEHPLGSFVYALGSFGLHWVPLGDSSDPPNHKKKKSNKLAEV